VTQDNHRYKAEHNSNLSRPHSAGIKRKQRDLNIFSRQSKEARRAHHILNGDLPIKAN
jgi:hypothetical protein